MLRICIRIQYFKFNSPFFLSSYNSQFRLYVIQNMLLFHFACSPFAMIRIDAIIYFSIGSIPGRKWGKIIFSTLQFVYITPITLHIEWRGRDAFRCFNAPISNTNPTYTPALPVSNMLMCTFDTIRIIICSALVLVETVECIHMAAYGSTCIYVYGYVYIAISLDV